MLLELTTALNLFLHSLTSQAQEATKSAAITAPATSPVGTDDAADSADSGAAPAKKKSRKRRRHAKHRADAAGATGSAVSTKKLPPYQGQIKRETGAAGSDVPDRYNDPTEVPLPNSESYGSLNSKPQADSPADSQTSRQTSKQNRGEVSDADLAPGPIIKNAKVFSSPVGQNVTTDLDPADRSFLRFGLHAGKSQTKYKSLDPDAREGAFLVGAQLGLATDLWDNSYLFGISLSGEENLRLDYITSSDSGVAQMIQMRLDSILLLGPDLDNERGLTPLVGLGVGYASAELRSIPISFQAARTKAQGLIVVPQVGVRWRFIERAAFDLKVEPLIATDPKLSDFGKLDVQLGLLIFI